MTTPLTKQTFRHLRLAARIGMRALFAIPLILLIAAVGYYLPKRQQLTMDGSLAGTQHSIGQFVTAVRNNNGVLVLGTSETETELGGRNYWAILNRDPEVPMRFSKFGGAGRTGSIWLPTLLNAAEDFRGTRILYFINPTYWRPDLNREIPEYVERYVSPAMLYSALEKAPDEEIRELLRTSIASLPKAPPDPTQEIRRGFRNFKGIFSYGVRGIFQDDFPPRLTAQAFAAWTSRETLLEGLVPTRNISASFLAKDPEAQLPELSPADLRTRKLRMFVRMAKQVGAQLTVVIGPYNGILGRRTPERVAAYEALHLTLRTTLDEFQCDVIDTFDLSNEPGAFIDVFHHSAYGAWLIAQRIKKHFVTDSLVL